MNWDRLSASLIIAGVFYIPVTALLAGVFYLIVRKHPEVTYLKIIKHVSYTGILPAGIFAYSSYTHGFYMDLVRDLFIMWGVLSVVYGMWLTSKYKVRN